MVSKPHCAAGLVALFVVLSACVAPAFPVPPPSGWMIVGTTGFSAGQADYISPAVHNNELYVAYVDGANGSKVTAMHFASSGAWSALGAPGFSAGQASYTSLAFCNGQPYVGYADAASGSAATVMRFDGTAWQLVGNAGFSGDPALFLALAADNDEPYVAFMDPVAGSRAVVMHYTGSSWETIGGGPLSPGMAVYPSLAFCNDEPHIAYDDNTAGCAMYYAGGIWQTLGGAPFSSAAAPYTSLTCYSGQPYVAYSDGAISGRATLKGCLGGTWQTIGTAGFSSTLVNYVTLAFVNGEPYVGYQDTASGGKAVVQYYHGGAWQVVGFPGLSLGSAAYTSLVNGNGEPYLSYQDAGYSSKAIVKRYQILPTVQATNVLFSGFGAAQATVGWTRGNGGSCAVFMKQTSTGTPAPVNSTTYAADSNFGSGSQIGATGWFCVYNGTGTDVTVTGLTSGAAYRVGVCEYNGVVGCQTYYSATSTGNPANVTMPLAPTVTTDSISGITASAGSGGGQVVSDGGATVTARGLCWNTTGNPTTSDVTSTDGAGTGVFASSLVGLSGGTQYYVRAYATNAVGTAYGTQVSFTTLPAAPVGAAATSITAQGFTANWAGVTGATGYRLNVATDAAFTSFVAGYSDLDVGNVLAFPVTGLTVGTPYYYRVRAYNGTGTGDDSDTISVSTLAVLATVSTAPATAVTATAAVAGGEVKSDGGGAVTVRGTCWSTVSPPTTADSHTCDGSGSGAFSSTLTGLSPGTIYYVRAYATNSAGTAYGDERSFTTTANEPTVTTAGVSDTTATTATCGGEVTSDGGAAVTVRGICWSTGSQPTTAGDHTGDGGGTGSFATTITVLTPGVTYHVRAYATNSIGTSYGADVEFTTSPVPPTVVTADTSNITATTATCGGNVTSAGGAGALERGICWNTLGNPTTLDSQLTAAGGTGQFSSELTGLQPDTLYYVRAYARNSVGTSYGSQVSFTTGAAHEDPPDDNSSGGPGSADSPPQPQLAVSMTVDSEGAEVGQELSVQVIVDNLGGAPASGAALNIALPPNVAFVSAAWIVEETERSVPLDAQVHDNWVMIFLGDVPGGAQLKLELMLQPLSAGTVTLTANAACDEVSNAPAAQVSTEVSVNDTYWWVTTTVSPIHACGAPGMVTLVMTLGLMRCGRAIVRKGTGRRH